MARLFLLVIVVSVAWFSVSKYRERHTAVLGVPPQTIPQIAIPPQSATRETLDDPVTTKPSVRQAPTSEFVCDGRIYCSQMTSCAEATYFLKNCPGTKMDGDGDGVPCERQWCSK